MEIERELNNRNKQGATPAKEINMSKKVRFIGCGGESVAEVEVIASTNREAFEKAEHIYKEKNWNFHYIEMEIMRG